jgi:hypothetical protein
LAVVGGDGAGLGLAPVTAFEDVVERFDVYLFRPGLLPPILSAVGFFAAAFFFAAAAFAFKTLYFFQA